VIFPGFAHNDDGGGERIAQGVAEGVGLARMVGIFHLEEFVTFVQPICDKYTLLTGSLSFAHTPSLSLSLSPARTHTHTQTHTRHTSSPPPLSPLPTPPPHIYTRTHTHMQEKGRHNLHRQRLPRERLLHTHSVQEEENERSCALIVRTDHSVRDRTSEREFIW